MIEVRRLFFALWPDASIRAEIVDRFEEAGLEGQLGGRRVPYANLHLTLVFFGDVAVDRVDGLIDGVDRLEPLGRCRLALDRFGTFPAAGVAWLGAQVEAPAQRLVDALTQLGMEADLCIVPRPWRPHVTLLRRIERKHLDPRLFSQFEPIDWPVESFSLVESIRARPYQVLRTWPVE